MEKELKKPNKLIAKQNFKGIEGVEEIVTATQELDLSKFASQASTF